MPDTSTLKVTDVPRHSRPSPCRAARARAFIARQAGAAEGAEITTYSSEEAGAISSDLYRPTLGAAIPNDMRVPGYALVRQDRDIKFETGRSTVKFANVAGLIDPTTVSFTSLSESRSRVLEQNFQFDLVSTDKLLLKYIDQPIVVERAAGNHARRLAGRYYRRSTDSC